MKKMLPWLITILLSITLIVVAAVLLIRPLTQPSPGNEVRAAVQDVTVPSGLSADEIVEVTSTIDGIKTNLSDPSYVVVIDFAFQLIAKLLRKLLTKSKTLRLSHLSLRRLQTLSQRN